MAVKNDLLPRVSLAILIVVTVLVSMATFSNEWLLGPGFDQYRGLWKVCTRKGDCSSLPAEGI